MDRVVPILAIAAIVVTGIWFQYWLSRGRMWTPLWLAFSTTATSIMFVVAGTIGYNLDRHASFVARTPWAPGVIWWEVGAGVALAILATLFWRQALRSR